MGKDWEVAQLVRSLEEAEGHAQGYLQALEFALKCVPDGSKLHARLENEVNEYGHLVVGAHKRLMQAVTSGLARGF